MFKEVIRVFLFAHILGDFYFQSDKLAENKQQEFKFIIWHGFLYLLVSLLCIVPFFNPKLLIITMILAFMHFLVDALKYFFYKNKEEDVVVYLVDQATHLLLLIVASLMMVFRKEELLLLPGINKFFMQVNIDINFIFAAVLLLLLMAKPINITIKLLLEKYKVKEDEGIKNAGAFIGTLERIIIVLLVAINQFSTIGLVLTAKSVARYNRIAEDKQFAEYYLLGTLLSTLLALTSYFIIM